MSNTRSRRRDPNATVGFVNFPVDRIQNTGEGGCFVRLVVIDSQGECSFTKKWPPCCGGYQEFSLDETFLGDDQTDRIYPAADNNVTWDDWDLKRQTCIERYFPNYYSKEPFAEINRYTSISFLCVMTIGATGWSSGEWVCNRNDLTPEGIQLIESLEKLYPDCEIRLLTFLDT